VVGLRLEGSMLYILQRYFAVSSMC